MTRATHAVVFAIVLAQASLARAQQPPASPLRELSLEQLAALEVTTVSKQPSEVWRAPAAITVLTQDDIRRSGQTTLAGLLRLVTGVQVSRLDSGHWAVGIRGLTNAFSKSLLVLIDGRSVYTPLFGGVYWQVQDTLLEDIERIEVIRGPGGTIWGANAVNGVINVITRHSRDTQGVVAMIGAGNVEQGRVGIRYGGSRGDDLQYRVYGTGFMRDALSHSDGNAFDDWRIAQAGFRVDSRRSNGATVRFQGDAYNGRAGDSTALGSFSPPSRIVVSGPDHVSGGNLLARWEQGLSSGGGYRLQAYYDRTIHDAQHYGETRDTLDVDFLHDLPLGERHHVSWGAGARSSRSNFTTVYPTLSFTPEDRTYRLASVFAQDEIAVRQALWLTVGTKIEHNSDTGAEIQPSARLLWRPTTHETVWGAVTRAVRTPSRIESDLQLTVFGQASPPVYLSISGSKDFEAETVVGVEAGYRRLFGSSFYVDVAAFHSKYDKLAAFGPFAITVPTAPIVHIDFHADYVNGISGTTDGFEITPDWRPRSWLQFRGAYAFLSIDMVNDPGLMDGQNVPLYEGASPRHQGFLQASVNLPRRIELDYAQRFAGRLRAHDIPSYATGDVRLGWEAARGVTLAVAGHNLWSPDHVEFFRDDVANVGIPRSVHVSVTWRR